MPGSANLEILKKKKLGEKNNKQTFLAVLFD